jgi:hypothetical protein
MEIILFFYCYELFIVVVVAVSWASLVLILIYNGWVSEVIRQLQASLGRIMISQYYNKWASGLEL